MNIYQAINKIMEELPHIPKARRVDFGNTKYNFRGIDDIYQALQPLLIKHKVVSVPAARIIHNEKIETSKTDPKSGEIRTSVTNRVVLEVVYVFYAEDGSQVSSAVISEGMDTGDKACNKAMSAAHKYALLQVFCIPTEEAKDSENEHFEQERSFTATASAVAAAKAAEKKITSSRSPTVTEPLKVNTSTSTTKSPISDDHPENYVIEFGEWKGQTVGQVLKAKGPTKLKQKVNFFKAKENNGQNVMDFIEAAEAAIEMQAFDQQAKSAVTQNENLTEKLNRMKNSYGPPQDESPFPDEAPF